MTNRLRVADETLAQILDQALAVDDDDFSSCNDLSPFANRRWSSANTLFVCKRWMRIGTPALYHTIILRSDAQAQSLMRTLEKSQLGTFVRKLRLEGRSWTALATIFKVSTNMTDFCFQVSSTPYDTMIPLNSLVSVSLRRIIFWKSDSLCMEDEDRLRKSLEEWLPSLTKPVHLVAEMDFLESSLDYETSRIRTDVPYFTAYIRIYSSRGPCIPRTLAAVLPEAHFKQLYLDYVERCETDEQDTEQRVVNRIQKKLSAQGLSQYQDKIRVRFRSCPAVASWASLSEQRDRLSRRYLDAAPADQVAAQGSPMDGQTRLLQVAIWAMILRHLAESVHYSRRSSHLTSFSTVCQLFRAAVLLVMPEHLHLTSNAAGHCNILSNITTNHVLSVTNRPTRNPKSIDFVAYSFPWYNFDPAFFSQFSTFTFLRYAQFDEFPWNSLPDLASALGPMVIRLEITLVHTPNSDSVAAYHTSVLRFVALRWLSITQVPEEWFRACMGVHFSWDLPQLERLDARSLTSGYLDSLTQSTLPRICHFGLSEIHPDKHALPASFLASHGWKLQKLVILFDFVPLAFNACPNLVKLSLLPIAPLGKMVPPTPLLALREIELHTRAIDVHQGRSHWHSVESRLCAWRDLLESFDGDKVNFPALERVIMVDYTWPGDAFKIQRSTEVIVAEELIACGLTVIDSDGTSWRPRLRTGDLTGMQR